MCADEDIYRDRIYAAYVHARDEPLAPDTLAGLRPRLPYLRRLVARHFPAERDARILDLGCGHGALIYVLQQAGYTHARGIDGSPEQVAAARRLGIPSVEHGHLTAVLADTPSESLDVVVTFDVIEHLTKVEMIPIIDAIHRALKPGGRWIIHAPNGEGPFGARVRYGDFTHELAFTRTSLTQLLKASGFSEVNCFEDQPIPHGIKSAMRWMLWNLTRATLLLYIAVEMGGFDRRAVFSQNLLSVAVRDEGA